MDIKEKIKQALRLSQEQIEPHLKEKEEALKKYEAINKELSEPVWKLIDEYYDVELVDSEGTTINVGDVLIHRKGVPSIKVNDRGMQFVFGRFMWNPRVFGIKVNSKLEVIGKKTIELTKNDLKEYTIIIKA